ncbi:hypothetical protein TNIN_156931 [Trichonephila inaurata madagascariensis]|uniref:Secreted protein n=1 Tax=Trichonephila inaurata madagascariensis TaxID=2747483 RepID=A0A8X7C7C8_9ARAC|nr:hypothetical protein TNIN_156931 [Trichonephila inaurata madagascariensis]
MVIRRFALIIIIIALKAHQQHSSIQESVSTIGVLTTDHGTHGTTHGEHLVRCHDFLFRLSEEDADGDSPFHSPSEGHIGGQENQNYTCRKRGSFQFPLAGRIAH